VRAYFAISGLLIKREKGNQSPPLIRYIIITLYMSIEGIIVELSLSRMPCWRTYVRSGYYVPLVKSRPSDLVASITFLVIIRRRFSMERKHRDRKRFYLCVYVTFSLLRPSPLALWFHPYKLEKIIRQLENAGGRFYDRSGRACMINTKILDALLLTFYKYLNAVSMRLIVYKRYIRYRNFEKIIKKNLIIF